MRVPVRRAGIAVLAAALVLVALDVTLLHATSSAPPANAGATSRDSEPGGGGVSGRPTGQAGHGAPVGRLYTEPAPGTGGDTQASGKPVAPPAVTVTGAAALPSAHVHPGYDTPEDAVDGFYDALLGGIPSQACAYATKPCPSYGSGRITGQVSIVNAVSDGAEALVELTGTICRSVTCLPLADRVLMPTSRAAFGTSWASLTSGVYGWAGSPLPCVRDVATGQWHVKLS
jgi:hypothetical protein